MSDAFGFMFGFYGLLLGLAVAEVVSGFSRAYDERHKRRLGTVAAVARSRRVVSVVVATAIAYVSGATLIFA